MNKKLMTTPTNSGVLKCISMLHDDQISITIGIIHLNKDIIHCSHVQSHTFISSKLTTTIDFNGLRLKLGITVK